MVIAAFQGGKFKKRRTEAQRATLAMLFASWKIPVQCRFSTTGQQLPIRAANFTWMCFTALTCLSPNPFTLEHFLKQFRFNFGAVFKPQTLTTKKTYQPCKVWSFTKIPVIRCYFLTNRSFMQLPARSLYCTLKHFGSETVKNGSLQGNCHNAPAKTRWSKQLATTAAFNFSEAS